MQLISSQIAFLFASILCVNNGVYAFAPIQVSAQLGNQRSSVGGSIMTPLHMSEENKGPVAEIETGGETSEEEIIDAGTKLQLEKQKKADELRSQEVFMQRSTGIHKCSNCGWEFDEKKGDAFLIGGTIQPGTPFAETPSNWRCPTCRASKDNFSEVTQEIPGFEVNQGYGFGGNSMTSGQKSGIVFGGLAVFALLFFGGYGLS